VPRAIAANVELASCREAIKEESKSLTGKTNRIVHRPTSVNKEDILVSGSSIFFHFFVRVVGFLLGETLIMCKLFQFVSDVAHFCIYVDLIRIRDTKGFPSTL
jgi:hypothetical protein